MVTRRLEKVVTYYLLWLSRLSEKVVTYYLLNLGRCYPTHSTYKEVATMTKRTTPQYMKRVKFSLSLPAWQRALLPHIDPKSDSRAFSLLVNAAIRSGALHTLAPGLPNHLTDPGALAAYLTSAAAQPHNAAPTQPTAVVIPACPSCGECVLDCECSEPLNPIPQTVAPGTPAHPYYSTPTAPGPTIWDNPPAPVQQTIWDKPADQLNDADLRELQRQAEASFLLNRPG